MATDTYSTNSSRLVDNYIYLYHIDEWLIIPEYPDSISDKMSSTFASNNALSRTAPVFTYSNSGPRSVNVRLHFHRDMLDEVNYGKSNMSIEDGEDYMDAFLRKIQSIALPVYDTANKSVVPPMVALRFGNELFVKGIVNGGVSVTYEKPILKGNKYAQADVSFDIYEVEPFDAKSVAALGSFRGITSAFKNGVFK